MNVTTVQHMELSYSVGDKINISNLFDIHQQQLLNNINNEQNTMELLKVLGGIDNVLTHYLSCNNNNLLNQSQLQQINSLHQQIIIT